MEKRQGHSYTDFCKCREIEEGPMIECEECKEWFHKEYCDVPQGLGFFSKSENLQ